MVYVFGGGGGGDDNDDGSTVVIDIYILRCGNSISKQKRKKK